MPLALGEVGDSRAVRVGETTLLDGRDVGWEVRNNRLHALPPNEIARRRRDIGMVFQQFNLFPHMSALQNIVEVPLGRGRGYVSRPSLTSQSRATIAGSSPSVSTLALRSSMTSLVSFGFSCANISATSGCCSSILELTTSVRL